MRRDPFLPFALAAGAAAVLPPAVVHRFGGEEVQLSGAFHFWAVGVSALVATVAGFALAVAGKRRQDARPALVGTAFTVMAGLLVVHGLATPYFLVGMNGVVSLTGAATLPLGGAILALAALPTVRRHRNVEWIIRLQVVLVAGVVALGVSALVWPSLVPDVPEPGSAPALALLALGFAFYGLVGLRALRTVLLARRAADLLVLVGIVWLAASLVPALTQDYRSLGWWIGHFLEVGGILVVAAPVGLDLLRSAPSRPLAGDLRGAELVAAEEAYLGSQVGALIRLLAAKDGYTEGHTRRVALLAVQVGEELGIPPARLRELAIGGLLHDIGKLSVPDEILKKPGPLDDEEYGLVRRHPVRGDALLADLGFGARVRRLVRDHHERLDGLGYPNGAAAHELALETRVLTVCDVYDALRSTRVYRDAWTHDDAIALLREQAGSAFDARCVEALERVLAREHPPARAAQPAFA
ncbi:MAG TPA: HD-GYP domain-containing protein [Gaiellaceae bacterium]|nr:HD-GYP domain-containing protein [Gaiellaceae bacterium]